MAVKIAVKRVYDGIDKQDGARILVDKVWPRGFRKDELALDGWYKEIAPSTELRKWFHHDPKKWRDFKSRYIGELEHRKELAEQLLREHQHGRLTLLYAAKDEAHNHALVLQWYLERYLEQLNHSSKPSPSRS